MQVSVDRTLPAKDNVVRFEQVRCEPLGGFLSHKLELVRLQASVADIADVDDRGAVHDVMTCLQLGSERASLDIRCTAADKIPDREGTPSHAPSSSKFS